MGKTMTKIEAVWKLTLWLSVLFVAGGVASWGAYRLIGSEVDSQGILREPFALIPIGLLLVTAGLTLGGLHLLHALYRTFTRELRNR